MEPQPAVPDAQPSPYLEEIRDSDREYLWRMYQENMTQARHHETQRSTVATLLLAITGVVMSVLSQPEVAPGSRWPLQLFLCLLGLFGFAFSLKQYERFEEHLQRARLFRDALDTTFQSTTIGRILSLLAANSPENNKYLETATDGNASNRGLLWVLTNAARARHAEEYRNGDRAWLVSARLYRFWGWLYFCVTLLGLIMLVISLINAANSPKLILSP